MAIGGNWARVTPMRRLATVLLSLLMLSLVSCLGGSGDQSADTSAPSRVVMAVTADPDGLDPHRNLGAIISES